MNKEDRVSKYILVISCIFGVFNIFIIVLLGIYTYPYEIGHTIVAALGWLAAVLAELHILSDYLNKSKHEVS